MSYRLNDDLRAELRQAAARIIEEFRGRPNRKLSSRKEMRWGTKGSLCLAISGSKVGLWHDFEQGRGGDIIKFIKFEHGCSFHEALDYAARFVPGLGRAEPTPRSHDKPALRIALDQSDDDERRTEYALGIWSDAQPLRGTLAETYLRSRAIEVPDEALDALRFHPSCRMGGAVYPALVALIRDVITDEPIGIHRKALSANGTKIERKCLGFKDGGAIKLSPSQGITTELTIAEGIETALSAMMLGHGPAWSVVDAGEMSKFPVLPDIELLIVIVDHDVSGAGQKAAAKAKARWERAGRRIRTVTPSTPGQDLNDVLKKRLGF